MIFAPSKMPRLKAARGFKQERLRLPRRQRVIDPSTLPQQVPWPFNSIWEYRLHQEFIKRDPRWIPQVQFGRRGETGSTRPDWIHPVKKIAFYLDTPIHHIRRLEGKDKILRASLTARGWKVIVWDVPSEEYAVKNFTKWYNATIDGLGYYGAGV